MQSSNLYITDVCTYIPEAIALGQWLNKAQQPVEDREESFFKKHLSDAFKQTQIICNGESTFTETELVIDDEQLSELIPIADELSQFDIAKIAMDKLVGQAGCDDVGLLVYCHTSIDENVLQSNVCRLAKDYSLDKAQHFSVSQNQGANFFVVLELIQAIMAEDEDIQSAIVVLAEKWAHPYPKSFYKSAIYADGAVAVKISRNASKKAMKIRNNILSFDKPILSIQDKNYVWDDVRARQYAIDIIRQASEDLNLPHKSFLIGSAGCRNVDNVIAREFSSGVNVIGNHSFSYLCAAEIPYLLANFINCNEAQENTQCVLWGVGASGLAGAMLLEVVL
ncbi:hypothetical protein [Vibrio lentus]|uniref:hypothetical protein n=1 Tax=Vibrio lentus TaxID=136468 RepID=UPI000C82A43C|nr:hypothetical protein [Vibrio lentus]PMG78021.1 hypothetical protein BCU86_21115 [Vibrio lentus]